MGITVTVLAKQVLKNMERYQNSVNFGVAKTLTGAAWESRKAVQANLPKWLDIRKPFLAQSIVVNRATKERLVSEVQFLPRAKMAFLLEEGGTKRPKGKSLAVPVRGNIDPKKITKSKRPAALLARKDTFSAEIRGVAGVWQRLPGQRLKLLYAYEPQARFEKGKIHFRKTVDNVARKFIQNNLSKNLAQAFKTSK